MKYDIFIVILLSIMATVFYHFQEIYNNPNDTIQDSIFLNETCPEPVIVTEKPTEPHISVTYLPITISAITTNETMYKHPEKTFLKDFGKLPKNQYDYSNINYPIPFNIIFNDLTKHYVNFGKVNSIFPSFILTGFLPQFKNQLSDILFMTGASDNHSLGSFNCLYSILLANPFSSLMYIDYGLSSHSLSILVAHFDTLHQIQTKLHSDGFLAYRKYNWNAFPSWMHLTEPRNRGGYSWKMIAVYDAFFEWKGFLSWMDGGNLIVDSVSREITAARHYGIFSPPSQDTIGKWVHKDMRIFALRHKFIQSSKKKYPMASGGVLFIDYAKSITHQFMEMLVECCYTQQCVAPKKASIVDHRQDQSILTLLLHEFRIPRSASEEFNYHPSLRNDGDNKVNLTLPILENLMIALKDTYHIDFSNRFVNVSGKEFKKIRLLWLSRPIDI